MNSAHARTARASSIARALGRLGASALTIAGLLAVTFALSSLSPIDPVRQLVGDHASESAYRAARHALGLDVSRPLQFAHYVARLAHGDLGLSRSTGQPVSQDLARVFPATIELATIAMAVCAVVGIAAGMLGAARPGRIVDQCVRALAVLGASVPIFWLGLVALYVFYARLHWTGGPGRLDDAYEYTIDMHTGFVLVDAWRSSETGAFASAIAHLVLPVLVLAFSAVGNVARLTRTAMLGELGHEYVTLARAKGASERRILLSHVLPNIAGTLLTVLALGYASLLEGAVLTETIFAWPGIGRYLSTALFASDTPAILGATLVIGIAFVLINGVTDWLVHVFDPRLAR
ncbi:ABC transporter permease [Pararobbsia silviterrae]|uniref:ABC transporter permease n=1 Tax=Pararobbsia silviterrae TaxID=1792498 RepID=UPI001F0BA0CE|nr:ABC transporter permease [Pararobbsia silviterrae]